MTFSLVQLAAQRVVARKMGKAITDDKVPYRYDRDPVAFFQDVLHFILNDYQQEIVVAFQTIRRVASYGPHGYGKTAIIAGLVCWLIGAFSQDTKIVTTAGSWLQLIKYTWPEIRKWAVHADWSKVGLTIRDGHELLTRSLKVGDKEAFAAATNNPQLIEGAHATNVGYVFDEAKAIPNPIFEAASGAFASAGEDTGNSGYQLIVSTPGQRSGRFYDICRHAPGFEHWYVRHVTLDEAIAAKRISTQWVNEQKAELGENSPAYIQRVQGDFADDGSDSVIPLAWIEAANQRWAECGGKGTGRRSRGIDPAYTGADKTADATLVGNVCETIEATGGQDLMATVGKVAGTESKTTPIAVDVIGIGAGVYSRLRELGYNAVSVNVATKTDMHDRTGKKTFFNLRSALWWLMRDALDPDGNIQLALPPRPRLIGDLTAPTYTYTSRGEIVVESKDKMRERIGRSTDEADALGLGLYAQTHSGVSIDDLERLGNDEINYERVNPALLALLQENDEELHD
jgi:hypothetical protein